jgi:hypothetical protein
MNLNSYQTSWPTTDNNFYVERQADDVLLTLAQDMRLVTIMVPHHQGKTSLVSHLMTRCLLPKEIAFVYVNMSSLDIQSESVWYRTLCKRISHQLDAMHLSKKTAIPQNGSEWREFLSTIGIQARKVGRKIIIILDEIEIDKINHKNSFFKILRDVSQEGIILNNEFKYLTFILIGALNPSDLIEDYNGLTFNVGYPIDIPDFNLEHVKALLTKRGWVDAVQLGNLATRIYYWTNGQPYLTQCLCNYLTAKSTLDDVDFAVRKLIRDDTKHLLYIVKAVKTNSNLKDYILKILKGEKIPYLPNQYSWQYQLYYLGLINYNEHGYCEIRNRIYERIIKELIGKRKNMVESLTENRNLTLKIFYNVFVSLPQSIGGAILDILGKNSAHEATPILLGYILIILIILVISGFIDINSLRDWFTSWWRFFFPLPKP